MLPGCPDRGSGARHVDHEARAGHDAPFVSRDDSPGGPVVRAEVIGVYDQVATEVALPVASRPPGMWGAPVGGGSAAEPLSAGQGCKLSPATTPPLSLAP